MRIKDEYSDEEFEVNPHKARVEARCDSDGEVYYKTIVSGAVEGIYADQDIVVYIGKSVKKALSTRSIYASKIRNKNRGSETWK